MKYPKLTHVSQHYDGYSEHHVAGRESSVSFLPAIINKKRHIVNFSLILIAYEGKVVPVLKHYAMQWQWMYRSM
jgi:hypothetical protein